MPNGDEEEVEYTPMKMGARNPFVYAEHRLGTTINWSQMDQTNKKIKLKDAFGKDYEKIFDPRNGSDLSVQTDVATGDLRPCITVSAPVWNQNGTTYTDATRAYSDPVQGDLPDCYFIAALSSLAFLNMIPNNQLDGSGNYNYTFYKPPANEGGVATPSNPIPVTIKQPLDSTGKYHYSRSFTPGEIWVAMYEKAFARWVGNNTDTPDYKPICQGDPMLALINLTGRKFKTFIPGTESVASSTKTRYSTQNFQDGNQIYTKIKDYACKPYLGYNIAKVPMVAYTYDPRIEVPPGGITYTDATIVGNHAYSVMGVHTKDSKNYIVMRNPWGQKDPDPAGLPQGALVSGSWYMKPDLSLSTDAFFALRADVFKNYFKGFGWVYQ